MIWCNYMDADWFKALEREVAATNKTQVALKMGVDRATVSAVVNGLAAYGKGTAKTTNFEREFRRAYEQLECPYTGSNVGAVYCREHALCVAPTHNPLQMQHWQACQQCSHKPRPVAAPVVATLAVAFKPVPYTATQGGVGQAKSFSDANDEGYYCIGSIQDNPYPVEDPRSDYWENGFNARRVSDMKTQERIKKMGNGDAQQAGIIDTVTLPLPEVGAPQIAATEEVAA
ncbi:MAG: hypothetical protein Q7T62_18215 [Undibacterium sp.]|nr:hypothetical protein [Undibacterium sp.]